jgi:hypothetical protein
MIEHDEQQAPPAWYRQSVEKGFAVGQRVRIRVSAECRLAGTADSPLSGAGLRGHHPDEDGMMGRVIHRPIPDGILEQGHTVTVVWDSAIICDGARCSCGAYAPTELELIEPLPAEDGRGGT